VNERRINVAILGCGQIGARWDAARTSPAFSLTHAAAFSRHPRASLVAVCDPNREKVDEAAQRWGAHGAYTDAARLFAEHSIELAVVATSSAARWDVIEPALSAGVKVLVIEKPLATTLAESRRLASALDAAGIKSVVNYSRHWDPSMRELRDAIRAGELGAIQRMVGFYGKGMTNNGSHLIDLAGFLCDAEPLRVRALASPLEPGEASWSHGADPAADAQVVYGSKTGSEVHLTMLGTDQRAFTCFELRVIGSAAVHEISRGGRNLTVTSIEDDPNYAGYRIPGTARSVPARAMEAMDRMADEALQLALGTLHRATCDAHSALRTARAIEAVQRSSSVNGGWIDVTTIGNN
jgi:predicted dehydrogenase